MFKKYLSMMKVSAIVFSFLLVGCGANLASFRGVSDVKSIGNTAKMDTAGLKVSDMRFEKNGVVKSMSFVDNEYLIMQTGEIPDDKNALDAAQEDERYRGVRDWPVPWDTPIGDFTDELYFTDKMAVEIADVILKEIYGEDFFKDKWVDVRENQEKNAFIVSVAIKNQWPDGPWWTLRIDKKSGGILRIWSRDDGSLRGKLNITDKMAVDIADVTFKKLKGTDYIKETDFSVYEVKGEDVFVATRLKWTLDDDGDIIWYEDDLSIAVNKKDGRIMKTWINE